MIPSESTGWHTYFIKNAVRKLFLGYHIGRWGCFCGHIYVWGDLPSRSRHAHNHTRGILSCPSVEESGRLLCIYQIVSAQRLLFSNSSTVNTNQISPHKMFPRPSIYTELFKSFLKVCLYGFHWNCLLVESSPYSTCFGRRVFPLSRQGDQPI